MTNSVKKVQEQLNAETKAGTDNGVYMTRDQLDDCVKSFGNPSFDKKSGASKGKTEYAYPKDHSLVDF